MQIHYRHRHLGSYGQGRVLAQQCLYRLHAHRLALIQQLDERLLDARLPVSGRQL